ncbi:MAG: hypothetical protein ACE361_20130 [Aureliella sp.]
MDEDTCPARMCWFARFAWLLVLVLSFSDAEAIAQDARSVGERQETHTETDSKIGSEFWLKRATEAAGEIPDLSARDSSLERLVEVRLEFGDVARAKKAALEIGEDDVRLRVHLTIAQYFGDRGRLELCEEELKLARRIAHSARQRLLVMDAYLRLLRAPDEALKCIAEDIENVSTKEQLVEALIQYGFVERAVAICLESRERETQELLLVKCANKTARMSDAKSTEMLLNHLAPYKIRDSRVQEIYCELAEALAKNGRLGLAEEYATKVTENYIIRTHRTLRRIKEGTPIDAPFQFRQSPKDQMSAFEWVTSFEDAEEADRQLKAAIGAAEANPIEDSKGQFGPWNQSGELARIRMQYFQVAALYRKQGNYDEARERMEIAEDAIQVVSKENAFAAMMASLSLVSSQIRANDIEGLKRFTSVAEPYLWSNLANEVVEKVIDSGDIAGATKIAWRVVSSDRRSLLGNGDGRCDKIVSCLIDAGATKVAYEVLQANAEDKQIATALESAGHAMVRTGAAAELLEAKWTTDLSPEQRLYLAIGAARATIVEPN